MQAEQSPDNVDVSFTVPCTHRLRFTENLFETDIEALFALLEPSGDVTPQVQFWIDADVARAQPQLKHRLARLHEQPGAKFQPAGNVQTVVGGEAIKNDIHILERMLKVFNAADLDRRSYIVVIGGGAVLDAVGFAAAIAHRGIRLIRIPTTTLAQGDSGIGVKNSVNLFQKKNWIGTFAVPWAVINDQAMLTTLPDRDFRCGFSEAVKVSLLKDSRIFADLEQVADAIRNRDMEAGWPVLKASAQLHLKHITHGGDPFEALEARPLDFGHWSAHKLETMTGFSVRHGEAVGMGVAIDTVYSSFKHGLPKDDALRVIRCLSRLGLPMTHPLLHQTSDLFAGLEEFRQHLGGRLTVTMLKQIGKPIDVHEIDDAAMIDAIEFVAKQGAMLNRATKISTASK